MTSAVPGATTSATTTAAGVTGSATGGLVQGVNGKVVGTSTSKAGAAIETARAWLAFGLAAILL